MIRASASLLEASLAATRKYAPEAVAATLSKPLIIVSAPRSGSNLLFEQLCRLPGFWSIRSESHIIFHAFAHLRAENERLDSGSLDERHSDPQTCERVRAMFLYLLANHRGLRYLDAPADERPATPRLVEKTPRNALNIPFLLNVFPQAEFVYLFREPRGNIASLIEAWEIGLKTGRFVTFKALPGWDRVAWCFLLPSGWRAMTGKSLAEIAAFQWSASNDAILRSLSQLPSERWTTIDYDALIARPLDQIARICRFAGFDTDVKSILAAPLPLSRTIVTPPHRDKWRKFAPEIERVLPSVETTVANIGSLMKNSAAIL